jgi:FKBP-type peptidyl-prolyl cis-trans isomerase FkpA/FKBP-type peptidyl-prolyl cis-trans isomerase FklB
MVKGWREGLFMMKIGESWELYVPAYLAYGSRDLSGSMAPNSGLVSTVTLIDARCQHKRYLGNFKYLKET